MSKNQINMKEIPSAREMKKPFRKLGSNTNLHSTAGLSSLNPLSFTRK